MGRRRRWSPDDDRVMIEGAGAFALAWFAARLKGADGRPRTKAALYHRAKALWGNGGFRRGMFSLRSLAQDTGYHPDQIRRAQDALSHRYKRLSPNGSYLISHDQREDVLAWLRDDFWCIGLRLYNCLWCHKRERPHLGIGLCKRCYYRHRRLCARLQLPHTPVALRAWLTERTLPEDIQAPLQERLGRRWALDADVLRRLGTL